MAILPITIYGNKILKQKTKPVKSISDDLIKKIKDMFDTMRNANGIGLAANQVGFTESLFVIDLKGVDGYEKFKPVVMINPEIILKSEETEILEEGCLSLPGLRAEVERPRQIKVKFIDTDENEVEIEADDLFARVILHEYDHLIGKLIPDRVDSEIKKKLQEELNKIKRKEIKIDYPIVED
ncbi:MAG: peptide deformylase [Melioribacter sp.]|uniref:peptide deformylase n=1 Tax=Rosettibacter primus TaxID=3111523 RepID=UPI00247D87FB|nr:peptide deformylase [Melioribacter sp.]